MLFPPKFFRSPDRDSNHCPSDLKKVTRLMPLGHDDISSNQQINFMLVPLFSLYKFNKALSSFQKSIDVFCVHEKIHNPELSIILFFHFFTKKLCVRSRKKKWGEGRGGEDTNEDGNEKSYECESFGYISLNTTGELQTKDICSERGGTHLPHPDFYYSITTSYM